MLGNYSFGFSLTGLMLYALQLLPNIIWVLAPPTNNVLAKNSSAYPIMNIMEAIFGITTVALLILALNKGGGRNSGTYIWLAALFLLAYYVSWIFYYRGIVSPWLLIIGLAGMPPLYFLFAGFWLKNYIIAIPCVIFGAVHIAITCANYL